jgi:hypothetical protein
MHKKLHKLSVTSRATAKASKSHPVKTFTHLPMEVKIKILEHLKLDEKLALREASSELKTLVDDEERRKYNQWLKVKQERALLPVTQFTYRGFHPPILDQLLTSFSQLHEQDIFSITLESFSEYENFLREFFDQAKAHFPPQVLKLTFTLCFISILRNLTDDSLHVLQTSPFQANTIRLGFSITRVYSGIVWSNRSRSEFSFPEDTSCFLVMFARMMAMKRMQNHLPLDTLANSLEPIDFGSKLVLVGNRVISSKRISPLMLQGTINLTANPELLEAFKYYATPDQSKHQDWSQELNANFSIRIQFKSKEAWRGEIDQRNFNRLISAIFAFSWLLHGLLALVLNFCFCCVKLSAINFKVCLLIEYFFSHRQLLSMGVESFALFVETIRLRGLMKIAASDKPVHGTSSWRLHLPGLIE